LAMGPVCSGCDTFGLSWLAVFVVADLLDAVAVDLPDDAGEADRTGAAKVGVLRPVRSFSDVHESCLAAARGVDEDDVTVGRGVD